jgi:hypothetical protein
MKKKEIKTGTSEMYQATNTWISELKFIAYEEHFFEELILDYTVTFLDKEHIAKYQKTVDLLKKNQKMGADLLQLLQVHRNRLQELLDDIKVPNEYEAYRNRHFDLAIQTNTLKERNRKLKKELYVVLKKHLKRTKQKKITL